MEKGIESEALILGKSESYYCKKTDISYHHKLVSQKSFIESAVRTELYALITIINTLYNICNVLLGWIELTETFHFIGPRTCPFYRI